MNNNAKNASGYLELFIGPMFSKKTTTLINIYKKCINNNVPVVVINHIIDKRYGLNEKTVTSHDNISVPCLQSNSLTDIWIMKYDNKNANEYTQAHTADVILINEGQFFLDLYDVVVDMLKYNKIIYVAGLDGDFKLKKFGMILDLIPICDKVTKLNAFCAICKDGTAGIFTKRLTSESHQIVVGFDNYISVCRKCYNI